ncbi:MAG: metallophosphoesterase family protein [Flavobacteriales bacterium]|nr:metallophosphoesterase family protein [Flavobacteriales bacterium]
MKRILLLSDTHSYLDSKIEKYAKESDEIWHAGDIGNISVTDSLSTFALVRAVFGNIDGAEIRKQFKQHLRFTCEEVNVWLTHIGGYPGSYSKYVKPDIFLHPPKLFICGHSHILKVMYDKKLNLLHINPGAAGNYGFHKVKTLVRFCIDKEKITNLDVIELGSK